MMLIVVAYFFGSILFFSGFAYLVDLGYNKSLDSIEKLRKRRAFEDADRYYHDLD